MLPFQECVAFQGATPLRRLSGKMVDDRNVAADHDAIFPCLSQLLRPEPASDR